MRFDCELCGLSFDQYEHRVEHMQQHEATIPENRVFDCRNCRRSFFTSRDMDVHNRRVHSPYG